MAHTLVHKSLSKPYIGISGMCRMMECSCTRCGMAFSYTEGPHTVLFDVELGAEGILCNVPQGRTAYERLDSL